MGNVVVLGSINLDMIAVCDRHPERGETVRGLALMRVPGGKGANQAVAASHMGATASIIGAVGSDPDGKELINFLRSHDVDVNHIRVDDVPTGTASIVVDMQGETSIVAVAGANTKALDDPTLLLSSGDVLVSQLEVPHASIREFFERGKRAGCTTVLNASPPELLPPDIASLTDICVVNERELATSVARQLSSLADRQAMIDAARAVSLANEGTTLVLLHSGDVLAVKRDTWSDHDGVHLRAVDMTGAEDCFVGSLAALLSEGENLDSATRFASRAFALASTRRGASMPSRNDVTELLGP